MRLRGLRLSLLILLLASCVAGVLVAFVLQQQNEALDAADAVVNALEVRGQLRQLKSAIGHGPAGWAEVDALIERLRRPDDDSPRRLPLDVVDAIAARYGAEPDIAQTIVDSAIARQTGVLAERRGLLLREAQQARAALLAGSALVLSLLLLAFAIVVRDNRRRRAAEYELRAANEDLEDRVAARTVEQQAAEERMRELSRRLLQVQEDERRALARELHDEVGQQLGAIKLNLKAMARQAGATDARTADCLDIVEQTIGRIRDRALDLRPALLDDLGLSAALDWLCQQQAQRSGVTIRLVLPLLPTLDGELATAAYRIVQEALTNALKHSGARNIEVSLALDEDHLRIEIADDGCGFDVARVSPGVGLPGLRERVAALAGRVNIESHEGAGTYLRVEFPVPGDGTQDPTAAG